MGPKKLAEYARTAGSERARRRRCTETVAEGPPSPTFSLQDESSESEDDDLHEPPARPRAADSDQLPLTELFVLLYFDGTQLYLQYHAQRNDASTMPQGT